MLDGAIIFKLPASFSFVFRDFLCWKRQVFYILTEYSERVSGFPDELTDAGQGIRVERADMEIPP